MLSWFRRRKYRNEVLTEVMAIYLHPDHRFEAFLQHYFPGAFTAIRDGYEREQNKTELAIILAGAVMAATIEALDDDRRERIRDEVIEWAKTPGAIHDLHSSLQHARDGLAARLKWAIAYTAKLELTHDLDDYYWDYFCNEIYGSLAGKNGEERTADRVSGIFTRAIGT
jgi:hypothetical protein